MVIFHSYVKLPEGRFDGGSREASGFIGWLEVANCRPCSQPSWQELKLISQILPEADVQICSAGFSLHISLFIYIYVYNII
jgi:hypothetical protein